MNKHILIAAAFVTAGLAANQGFAQGLAAPSIVAGGVSSGPSLQRMPDAPVPPAPPSAAKPVAPPAAGAPAPMTAPTQNATFPVPSFSPAEYKQAAKDIVLINAAYAGETWNVKNALAKGGKINSSDWQYGFTPLMWASLKGHLGTVRYLLEHGAKVDTRSKPKVVFILSTGNRVLNINEAARPDDSGNWRLKRYLYTREGAVTALMLASAGGYNLTVRELLAHKANVALTESDGGTVLMLGAFAGNIPAAQALLHAGAKINAVDGEGASALMYAAYDGDVPMVRFLLARGARVKVSKVNATLPAVARGLGYRDVAAIVERAAKKEKDLPFAEDEKKSRPGRAPEASGDGIVILN